MAGKKNQKLKIKYSVQGVGGQWRGGGIGGVPYTKMGVKKLKK